MKIAAVSEDGVTISQHFGRAPYYVVVTVEDGKIASREQREKLGHTHFSAEEHGGHGEHGAGPHQGHGFDSVSQDRHARMAASISDCSVLMARGMGAGAYQSLESAGIRPILTDIPGIDDAVAAYLAGKIVDHKERLH